MASLKTRSRFPSESAEMHRKKIEETLERVATPLDKAAVEYLNGLKEGLESLNTVLASLGEKQVVIHREAWWRGIFKKKD